MIFNNKRYISRLGYAVALCMSLSLSAGEKSTRDIIQRAMRDELTRNVERLTLENLESPFYISYTIRDVKTMTVTATLGAVVRSEENRYRNHSVRVMVGSYSRTDENFLDFGGGSYRRTRLQNADALPLEDDYQGIRRALWIATDNVYKIASENYERKKAALQQQNLTQEAEALDDFSKVPTIQMTQPPRVLEMDRLGWEKYAIALSRIFRDYPDLYSSQVRVFIYQADVYFINNEDTETLQPLTLASVSVNASTQAVDGEPLNDHVLYYGLTPADLPSLSAMEDGIKALAEELVILRTAPTFDDSYMGPILLEGQAVAEFFAQRLFTGVNGLLSHRKPAVSDARSARYLSETSGRLLEENIDRRILSRDLSVKALPGKQTHRGKNLIGTTVVDGEGVRAPEEILLVENGMLKTLLHDRMPTPKIKTSNGHRRPIIATGLLASSALGPSVISVSTSQGKPVKEMKKKLLELAREEGLDYAIIVRKLACPISGIDLRMDPMAWLTAGGGSSRPTALTEPILVYRVSVEDGREEPVRSVKLGDVSLSTLRHLLGTSKEHFVYNTLVPAVGGLDVWYSYARRVSTQGVPASFIVPESLLLEELEVENAKHDFTPKMPVVSSPLAETN